MKQSFAYSLYGGFILGFFVYPQDEVTFSETSTDFREATRRCTPGGTASLRNR
jgi:hypothetical protein